jgi:hypothetical protein
MPGCVVVSQGVTNSCFSRGSASESTNIYLNLAVESMLAAVVVVVCVKYLPPQSPLVLRNHRTTLWLLFLLLPTTNTTHPRVLMHLLNFAHGAWEDYGWPVSG